MDRNNSPDQKKKHIPSLRDWIGILFIILAVALPLIAVSYRQDNVQETTLLAIVRAVEAGEIKSLTVQGDVLIATKNDGSNVQARKESNIIAIEALQLLGVSAEEFKTLPILVQNPSLGLGGVLRLLLGVVPILLIVYLIFRFSRQIQGGMFNLPGNIGRSSPRVMSAAAEKGEKVDLPAVTFDDVAGSDHAKLELQEVIEFLKEPEKFLKLGARTPKGVLMAGPPGTGKTLMAKAVAGEAGVPFFSISGSEFVEMFVGVGASRVRDLFDQAKRQSPCIVFLDEIDAVGRHRGAGLGGSHDEREQTLNQILVEMDGFATDTNVIVIAATNRPDVLDAALLRPGRFDRKVILDRPDVHARQAILEVHARGKPLADDISLSDLARLTPGFVGADLENLVNEAAILAARRNLSKIGRHEFQDAMERIVAGPERKSNLLSQEEREVVAYHEAGHAVVMHNLENSDPVHKVSIISRGMAR